MRTTALIAACVSAAMSVASPCPAQSHGAVPLRIDEGPDSRCINYETDQVWLTLYRVVTTKRSNWLRTSNQTALVMTVQVKTEPQSEKTLAFPLSTKVNTRDYGTGQVSLPVEYTLVSGLPLAQGTAQKRIFYTGFGVNTTVINLESRGGLGVALDALAQVVGEAKLPIPSNPYSQAAGYLIDFANRAVGQSIADHNADDKYTTASLALNFAPRGPCGGATGADQGFESTGTKAILMADGEQGPGYVPIDRTGDYCWAADTRPSFVLKAAPKVAGKPCGDPVYAGRSVQVTNNFVAYFLQKRQIAGHLGALPDRDKRESLMLCRALGVEEARCPAAR